MCLHVCMCTHVYMCMVSFFMYVAIYICMYLVYHASDKRLVHKQLCKNSPEIQKFDSPTGKLVKVLTRYLQEKENEWPIGSHTVVCYQHGKQGNTNSIHNGIPFQSDRMAMTKMN